MTKRQNAFTNAAYLGDPAEKLRAEGQQIGNSAGMIRNGGLRIERTRAYEDDTILVRFAQMRDRKTHLDLNPAMQLASGWWMTEDIFTWLMTRVHGGQGQARRNIQRQMLLPPEWNTADCVIRAFPRKGVRLGAWFGRPRSVLSAPDGVPMVMQGGGAEQTEDWMYQLYVPGLAGRPHNARNWLEFEGVYSTKPWHGPRGSFYPCIRKGKPHR